MDKNSLIKKFGNPKNWKNSTLYTRWSEKGKYDNEFVKLIEVEVEKHGGIEKIKKEYETEKKNKEEEILRQNKKKKLTKILLLSIGSIALISYFLYFFLTKEQKDYQKALDNNTTSAYRSFLESYPKSENSKTLKPKYIRMMILELYEKDKKNPFVSISENLQENRKTKVDFSNLPILIGKRIEKQKDLTEADSINEFINKQYAKQGEKLQKLWKQENKQKIYRSSLKQLADNLEDASKAADCVVDIKQLTTFIISHSFIELKKFRTSLEGVYNYADEFNKKCIKVVKNDTILLDFFKTYISKLEIENKSINALNFYGIAVRKDLEKKCDIKNLYVRIK